MMKEVLGKKVRKRMENSTGNGFLMVKTVKRKASENTKEEKRKIVRVFGLFSL